MNHPWLVAAGVYCAGFAVAVILYGALCHPPCRANDGKCSVCGGVVGLMWPLIVAAVAVYYPVSWLVRGLLRIGVCLREWACSEDHL